MEHLSLFIGKEDGWLVGHAFADSEVGQLLPMGWNRAQLDHQTRFK